MNIRHIALLCALALASCSGGGGVGSPASTNPITPAANLVSTSFVFVMSNASSSSAASSRPVSPKYVTANIKSVAIVLNTVNGATPPSGLVTSVTTNITPASCPCTVPGPSVPPGLDNFSLTTFDNTAGSGNVISTASPTYTIATGAANSNTVTLDGVPASFAITGVPTGTAGTAFGAATNFTVTVKDADGSTILGTYANPVALADSDASGATTVATAGSDRPPAGTLVSSSDTASLNYTGLAIAPATLTASATGATNGTATFTPALSAIVYSGPLVSSLPEIDLYATSGTGSSATFTASEVGWTNAPYNKAITATEAAGCSSIATTSPASGTSFTTTVATTPAAGSCALTLTDFTSGQSKNVTLTYTSTGFGVQ